MGNKMPSRPKDSEESKKVMSPITDGQGIVESPVRKEGSITMVVNMIITALNKK